MLRLYTELLQSRQCGIGKDVSSTNGTRKKKNLDPVRLTVHKNYLKWVTDLNVNQTTKHR